MNKIQIIFIAPRLPIPDVDWAEVGSSETTMSQKLISVVRNEKEANSTSSVSFLFYKSYLLSLKRKYVQFLSKEFKSVCSEPRVCIFFLGIYFLLFAYLNVEVILHHQK